jgi:hypothetical protein
MLICFIFLKLFVQPIMIRLLPTFLTENFGRVSCACKAQVERIINERNRNGFFMVLITGQELNSFVDSCKDSPA